MAQLAQTMTRTEARTAFGELISRARYQGAHTAVTLYGKPAAVIVPWDWWQRAAEVVDDGQDQAHEPDDGDVPDVPRSRAATAIQDALVTRPGRSADSGGSGPGRRNRETR